MSTVYPVLRKKCTVLWFLVISSPFSAFGKKKIQWYVWHIIHVVPRVAGCAGDYRTFLCAHIPFFSFFLIGHASRENKIGESIHGNAGNKTLGKHDIVRLEEGIPLCVAETPSAFVRRCIILSADRIMEVVYREQKVCWLS